MLLFIFFPMLLVCTTTIRAFGTHKELRESDVCYGFTVGKPGASEFYSPGYPSFYPRGTRCTRLISAAPGYKVMLEFHGKFQLENSAICEFDYLEVRDGADEDAPLIDKLCGDEKPRKMYSSGRYMWLEFSSDDNGQLAGFKATYKYVPTLDQESESDQSRCNDFIAGNLGKREFYSPNYPRDYFPNTICRRILKADSEQIVRLEFKGQFQLEDSPNCEYDSLEIRDGSNKFSPLIGKFCGDTIPPNVRSTGRFLWLQFSSDDTSQESGFKVIYRYSKY